MTNKEMVENNNVVIFEADDANDPTWETIISVLRENIPGFSVGYGDGDWMAFAVPKKYEEDESAKYISTLINKMKEIENPLVDSKDDDYGMDAAWEYVNVIIKSLPNVFTDDTDNAMIATNGDELLFRKESDCERFADALDKYVFGFAECHTGYYDPQDDMRSDEVDENTGWYYIDWPD